MYFAGRGALTQARAACDAKLPPPYRGTSAGGVLAALCAFQASPPCAEAFASTWEAVISRYLSPHFDEERLCVLRALVGALAGAPDVTFAACPRALSVVALDTASLRPVCFSAETTPDAPLALALAGCTAYPAVSPPVRWGAWHLVDAEFCWPPRAIELSCVPRSVFAVCAPAPSLDWPLSHPAADRLQDLLSFPRRMLERACSSDTLFLQRWPSSCHEAAMCVALAWAFVALRICLRHRISSDASP
jgi:hypothetical protein